MGGSNGEYYKCAECSVPTSSVECHTPVEANNNIRIDRLDCRLFNAVMNVPLSKHYAKIILWGLHCVGYLMLDVNFFFFTFAFSP